MGLDTSHNCWHGAYSAFMRWRIHVAAAAGYPPLCFMEGYCPIAGPFTSDEYESFERDLPKEKCYDGSQTALVRKLIFEMYIFKADLPIGWGMFDHDPLSILLRHSDCDGRIKHADCLPIARRLKEILPNMPEGDDWGHIGNWYNKTKTFIIGLMDAHKKGEDVIFG